MAKRKPAGPRGRGSTITINVFSVRQPYADLIITGNKFCENRSWTTDYRGPLYIHASTWDRFQRDRWDWEGRSLLGFATGAIIGIVELVDVIAIDVMDRWQDCGELLPDHAEHAATLSQLPPTDDPSWEHVGGEFCWILTNAMPLAAPIRAKGRLRIWQHNATAGQLRTARKPR